MSQSNDYAGIEQAVNDLADALNGVKERVGAHVAGLEAQVASLMNQQDEAQAAPEMHDSPAPALDFGPLRERLAALRALAESIDAPAVVVDAPVEVTPSPEIPAPTVDVVSPPNADDPTRVPDSTPVDAPAEPVATGDAVTGGQGEVADPTVEPTPDIPADTPADAPAAPETPTDTSTADVPNVDASAPDTPADAPADPATAPAEPTAADQGIVADPNQGNVQALEGSVERNGDTEA